MRAWYFALILLPTFLCATTAVAQTPGSSALGEIVTRSGITYKGVKVQRATPDGLVISFAPTNGGVGLTTVKFTDLPDGLQRQFNYNPTNAVAFERKQQEAERQWHAKWAAEDDQARAKRNEEALLDAESQAKVAGSGFFVTDNGYLLTCFHVVNHPGASIVVGTKQGVFPAELVQWDQARDIALLKVQGRFASLPLASSNSVSLGEPVFTIGFPDPLFQGWQPKLTRGEVNSLSGIHDNPDNYQISAPVQPGNSGGALMDERGNVVGIVRGKLNESLVLIVTGQLPQNVNYAVKSDCAKRLLEFAPGGFLNLKPEIESENRNFKDVVQASQEAVAVVLVE